MDTMEKRIIQIKLFAVFTVCICHVFWMPKNASSQRILRCFVGSAVSNGMSIMGDELWRNINALVLNQIKFFTQ